MTPLLTDLINKKGYTAINLICNSLYQERELNPTYTIEEADIIYGSTNIKEVLRIIGSKKMEIGIGEYIKESPLRKKHKRNHVITQAMDDTYTYYLDAINFEFYIPIPGREKEYISNGLLTVYNLEEKEFKDVFEIIYNLAAKEMTYANKNDIFMDMYRKILPALEEAEEIYKRILI